MKFLLSFLLWIFGAEAPVKIPENTPIPEVKNHQVESEKGAGNYHRNGLRDRRFGGHIIIFEDTHFRKQENK